MRLLRANGGCQESPGEPRRAQEPPGVRGLIAGCLAGWPAGWPDWLAYPACWPVGLAAWPGWLVWAPLSWPGLACLAFGSRGWPDLAGLAGLGWLAGCPGEDNVIFPQSVLSIFIDRYLREYFHI